MAENSTDLLAHWRQHTRLEHQALEQHPLLRSLPQQPTLANYGAVLLAFRQFYRDFERAFSPATLSLAVGTAGHYHYLPRLPLIEQDLTDIGIGSAPGSAPSELTDMALDSNRDYLLGVLYVLEGSTQGGRVISAATHRTLQFSGHFGCRYFTLYRQHSWHHFRAALAERDIPSAALRPALQGARDSFRQFYRLLDQRQASL